MDPLPQSAEQELKVVHSEYVQATGVGNAQPVALQQQNLAVVGLAFPESQLDEAPFTLHSSTPLTEGA